MLFDKTVSWILWLLIASVSLQALANADEPPLSAEVLKPAVQKILPLLEKGAAGSMKERPRCFTCHNQGLPLMALTTAKRHGFAVDEDLLKKQGEFIAGFLERNRPAFLNGKGTGGQVATAGEALRALETVDWKPDEATAAVSEYLLTFQKDSGHWKMTSDRPPSESSHFTANYLAIRALQRFSTDEQKERRDQRIEQARQWLLKTAPQETEDRVFQLLSLHRLHAADELARAADELLAAQRNDGGWSQKPDMESDAYATGSALVALHETGRLKASAPAYQRGLRFLLKTQQADGSWHVKSRSKPFQAYFESGFPHGTDQFISIAASSWAATALILACPDAP